MSTHVIGIRPPDETWRKMKAVWDVCKLAKVAPPKEVDDFFDGENPDEAGVLVEIDNTSEYSALRKAGAMTGVKQWHNEYADGFEVDLVKLHAYDPTVKVLRFYNSY